MSESAHSFANDPLPAEALPSVADIPWQRLHPRYPWVAMFSSLLRLSLAAIAGAAGIAYEFLPLTWLGYGALLTLLAIPTLMVWPAARVKRYALRERDILFREGLLWRSTTVLPRSRIQHIETRNGPIERATGLITLSCYGAGGQQADLVIPGLAEDLGQRLRQHLLDEAHEDPVTAPGESPDEH